MCQGPQCIALSQKLGQLEFNTEDIILEKSFFQRLFEEMGRPVGEGECGGEGSGQLGAVADDEGREQGGGEGEQGSSKVALGEEKCDTGGEQTCSRGGEEENSLH